MGEVARLLGKPFMPWQQYVADVALEIDPVTGRLVYDECGLTVPRQQGKSTLILAKAVHRASATKFFGPRQRIVYTAQTRNKAREKWEEDYAADLKASRAFGPKIRPHFGNGNEHIRFPNGSRFGIEANTEKAGHGGTLDEAYLDEAFAQVDGRLEQAFRPAMITRPNTQLWWVSTAGWLDGSPYLQDKVKRGREQAEMGVREGLAYFEWSAPEDADPEDRDVWRECMPALGHTVTEEAIAAELRAMADNIADFRRAYLNQWVLKTASEPSVIDLAVWAGLADEDSRVEEPVAFAADVTPDRSSSSIAIAGLNREGKYHLEVINNRPGVGWVVPRIIELDRRYDHQGFHIDPAGPIGSLIPELTEAGVDVVQVSAREYGQACGALYDAAVEGRLTHQDDRKLNEAVAAARQRKLGDAWAWHRRDATDISPLVAVTLALYGHRKASSTSDGGGWMVSLP